MSELLHFLIQVIVVVGVARAAGVILARWGQPPVIGEILAGILLGPSLLGWVAPGLSATMFPTATLTLLNLVSQFGLILFMFLVGLRLDASHLHAHGGKALWISAVSIAAPFAAGAGLALKLHSRLAPAGVDVRAFCFLVGVAMSVTAFPVLARILDDAGLLRTRLGSVAIACAAVDDVTAWVLLAGAVATAAKRGPGQTVGSAFGFLAVYALSVLAMRPALARLASPPRPLGNGRMTAVVLAGLISAALTEWIGIHALFGAFFAGIVMPKDKAFVEEVSAALQPLATLVLLPVFFAYTGLRMTIPILSADMLIAVLSVFAVAVIGKGGAAMLAARATGMSWRDSTCIGVLMNTRGLVELVVLNVGLDIGILSRPLFSIMVLMALATTGMTAPLLRLLRVKDLT
jgi:Kef-type K+ transport system membrane component KefB